MSTGESVAVARRFRRYEYCNFSVREIAVFFFFLKDNNPYLKRYCLCSTRIAPSRRLLKRVYIFSCSHISLFSFFSCKGMLHKSSLKSGSRCLPVTLRIQLSSKNLFLFLQEPLHLCFYSFRVIRCQRREPMFPL